MAPALIFCVLISLSWFSLGITPHKSDLDERDYRIVTLDNQLQAILVSDPQTDKAGASLDVHVGHFSDPEEVPGLAHFCEHMLFLGTEKYPSENSYNQWLSSHGGSANAFTSTEDTNYMFEVSHEFLDGTLDRFAQFFIAPLFTESATSREMNAVDSEHAKNLQSDNWRLYQFLKSTSNPLHPFHKFGTGDLETLDEIPKQHGIDVRQQLLNFYSSYYSANIMKLAVIGRETLDQLEALVKQHFSAIPNRNASIPTFTGHPFEGEQLMKQYKVVPVKEMNTLNLLFPFSESLNPFYPKKPSQYLGHLIGHEGTGGILSDLKKKGWASGLSAGTGSDGTDFALFSITISLTEEGLDHTNEIIRIVFQYIKLVKEQGISQSVWDELHSLAEMNFRFMDKTRPFDYATSLSQNLQYFHPEDVLTGGYLFTEWDQELITRLAQKLEPQNMRIEIVSRNYEAEADLAEKWYGTAYSVSAISHPKILEWNDVTTNPDLSLPQVNKFIPDDFAMKDESKEKPNPVILHSDDLSVLWHKLDTSFKKPQANWHIVLHTPVAYESPESTLLTSLFIDMYSDSINEELYPAKLAGLGYGVSVSSRGIEVEVSGFNQKQDLLFSDIFSGMLNFANHTDISLLFSRFKEEKVRAVRNYKFEAPYTHAVGSVSSITIQPIWRNDEYLQIVEGLTLEQLVAFIPRLFSALYIEAFAHGNVYSDESTDLLEAIETLLPTARLFNSQMSYQRVVEIPGGSSFAYRHQDLDQQNVNSGIEVYYQVGSSSLQLGAMVDLMGSMLYEPFFNQLRTNEQLGYIVFAGIRRVQNVEGLRFIIQSSTKDGDYLDARITSFIENEWKAFLDGLSAEDWLQYVNALISSKTEKPKSLDEKTVKYWNLIKNREDHWNRTEDEVTILSSLKKEELISFTSQFLSASSPSLRRLSVRFFGQGQTIGPLPTGQQEIQDIDKFKESLSLHPPFPNLHQSQGKPMTPSTTTESGDSTSIITSQGCLEPSEATVQSGGGILVFIVVAQSIFIVLVLLVGFFLLFKWRQSPTVKQNWIKLQEHTVD